jgi:hypothetical protein
MAQNTNLNTSPYFDDFNIDKNYQRVLFKPGIPLQARELTTLQSVLQNQVEQFGKHFFKEGSVVIPGNIAYDPEYSCVQIDPTHLGIPVSTYIDSLIGANIKGQLSGVSAKVENYITQDESERKNYTLYIKYTSASEKDFVTNKFQDGENLIVLKNVEYSSSSTLRENSTFATTILSGATATGSAAKIQQGVYFIRGFFVNVNPQTVILDQYTNLPSYRIGLSIEESIATSSQTYPDLYDNARGFSNFAAPGADRLKIDSILIKKSLEDFNDENFIELLRIENGERKYFQNDKENTSTLIQDELARRTYDESGDYYINPFKIQVKESLNDRLGNNGVYYAGQLTKQGKIPSDDLLSIQISPGKAYVKGFEVETINTINVDLEKPRTTQRIVNTTLPFSLGNQVSVNNVYGSISLGYGTTVKLFGSRTVTPGTSSGLEVGVARVYDLKLKNTPYVSSSTPFDISLYDIQTYTYVTFNSLVSFNVPTLIEGANSGAYGYLVSSVSNKNQVVLYQVSGKFQKEESVKVNGLTYSRTITNVRDYDLTDICQITSLDTTSFTSDTILDQQKILAPTGSSFTINSSGIVTNSYNAFTAGISTGDIISYTKPGEELPTYNRVIAVDSTARSITLNTTNSVVGVNSGSLPSSTITVTDFNKVFSQIKNNKDSYFYVPFQNNFVSSVELDQSEIVIRKSYSVTVSSFALTATLEADTSLTLEPFNSESYTLTYSNGVVEQIDSTQFLVINGRTVNIVNLSQNGSATLTVTLRKRGLKSRKKNFNRATILTIDSSSSPSSGIGGTTLNDGLTYSSIYGTRVQDDKISLNVPDVQRVLAVLESADTSDAKLPKLVVESLNTSILNTLPGELIVGSKSGALASLVNNNGTNTVEFVYYNENSFIPAEKVIFQESQVTAKVTNLIAGDRNILTDFILDPAQYTELADYSFLKRREGIKPPTRRLKIVYQNYSIDSNDDGDLVTISSFAPERFSNDLLSVNGIRSSDVVDLRPRVLPYNSTNNTRSPFEYYARKFDSTTSNSKYLFAKDSLIILTYSFYLGRIDKLYVNKNGEFFVNKGVPSTVPQSSTEIANSLDIATLSLPPYVFEANDIRVSLSSHKRYRMQDISVLEDKINNVASVTSLSLLETDTKNLTIRDGDTNLNKFKSGFFVDNFKNVFSGAVGNVDHKCSIDTESGVLRPQSYTTSVDLVLGSEAIPLLYNTSSNPDADYNFVTNLGSPNTVKTGDIISLKYNEVLFLQNKFATRQENINPFNVINWVGTMQLSPSSDTWVETSSSNRTLDVEGSYRSTMESLGIDSNTGLSPIDWGGWETTWTGSTSRITSTQAVGSVRTGTTQTSSGWNNTGVVNRRRPHRSGQVQQTDTTVFTDEFINFTNQTTLTTTTQRQSRSGSQFRVSETFNTQSLGNRVVSTDIIHTMRSRNIEFIAKRLKPKTRMYGFFDNVNVNPYIVPKLLEISMVSGTFSYGERVTGTLGSVSISFRLAQANHKYGPYNSATDVFVENPYNPTESLPPNYSSTSKILNVDTSSLQLQSDSQYYGYVISGMQLVGQTSNAVATIGDIKLVSDSRGVLIGSLFIPNPRLASTPRFTTGSKTFTLTTSSTNITISGATDSTAESAFTSAGTLNNQENTTLRIRNATIERSARSEERTQSSDSTDTQTTASTSSSTRSTTQTRWVDPLAQSFTVDDRPGVFITKCDVFFATKDTKGIPVTMQIRTLQTGLPTLEVLPFGEIILDSDNISTSTDATIPSTFHFPSPVYLEGGKSYAIVLLSASDEYKVWISRMGEEDKSNATLSESQKIIVSQQPLLGSLFKSQNGATWDPSQLEDLKLTLYRADFVTTPSSVRFYNPLLGVGNRQVTTLRNNPLDCISRKLLIGIGKSLSSTEVSNLQGGTTILQNQNSNFSGYVDSISGSVGIGSTLVITNVGSAFTSGFRTYSNVSLISRTGNGSGAKVNISVQGGVAIAATVSIGGTGYTYGDAMYVDYSQTDNLGKNLILSIPNTNGVISNFNSILLTGVQGTPKQNSTDYLFYVGSGGTSTLGVATITSITTLEDGLHFKVSHSNHGMYSSNDRLYLYNIESDLKPETINASINSSTTGNIVVSNVGIFTTFENVQVSAANTGYIKIGTEVIGYTDYNIANNELTGITRGIERSSSFPGINPSSLPSNWPLNTPVYKYELNGVSLRRINRKHKLIDTDLVTYPTDLDEYYIKVDMSSNGVDRTANNVTVPQLYFKQDKSCGSYDSIADGISPVATQNIPFNIIRPNVQTLIPEGTTITAKVRTVSGVTPNGSQSPFIDQGFEDISLDGNTVLSSPRIICSRINEIDNLTNLPGNKSLTMELTMNTRNSKVSPLIDLERVNLITIANRINSPISNYVTDSRVNFVSGDPTAGIYISKFVNLEKSSDSLKVFFDAYRPDTSDIRVLYRILRPDGAVNTSTLWELFPGYDNLDNNGLVINSSQNNGKSDKFVSPSTSEDDLRSYEFTASRLPQFTGFQIKIHLTGTNSSFVPKIRDLRVIASI